MQKILLPTELREALVNEANTVAREYFTENKVDEYDDNFNRFSFYFVSGYLLAASKHFWKEDEK